MKCKNIKFFGVVIGVIIGIVILFELFKHKYLLFDNTLNLSSILTFFSVIIATSGFIITSNNYNNNQKQYNEQQKQKKQAEERSQALNIAGWFNSYAQTSDSQFHMRAEVTISNSTNIPVYQMFVFMVPNKIEIKFEDLNNSGGNNTTNYLIYLELVKPGETHKEVKAAGHYPGGGHDSVAILFKDTSSKYWYRSNFGSLERISNSQFQDKFQKNEIYGPYSQYAN